MSDEQPSPAEHNALLNNIRDLLNQSHKQALQAVNIAMVQTYWQIVA